MAFDGSKAQVNDRARRKTPVCQAPKQVDGAPLSITRVARDDQAAIQIQLACTELHFTRSESLAGDAVCPMNRISVRFLAGIFYELEIKSPVRFVKGRIMHCAIILNEQGCSHDI